MVDILKNPNRRVAYGYVYIYKYIYTCIYVAYMHAYTVADPGHLVTGRFICFTFSVATSSKIIRIIDWKLHHESNDKQNVDSYWQWFDWF